MSTDATSAANEERVRQILTAIKPLAGEFYRLTGKPLGVTGEIAEYVAAEKLGLMRHALRAAGPALRTVAGRRRPGYF